MAAGQIGLAYNFQFHFNCHDYRPALYFLPEVGGAYDYVALGVRIDFENEAIKEEDVSKQASSFL